MFPKNLLAEYQNVKIVKSKFKSKKSNKNKHSFKRKQEKKNIKIARMSVR